MSVKKHWFDFVAEIVYCDDVEENVLIELKSSEPISSWRDFEALSKSEQKELLNDAYDAVKDYVEDLVEFEIVDVVSCEVGEMMGLDTY